MNVYFTIATIILSLVSVASYFLAFIVYLQGRNVLSNRFFSAMACSSATWVALGVGLHYANEAQNIRAIELLNTASFIAAVTILVFAFFLVKSLETGKLEMTRAQVVLFLIPYGILVFALLAFPKAFIERVIPVPEYYMNTDVPVEPGYTTYSLYFLAVFAAGAYVSVRKRAHTNDPFVKLQFLYIFIGVTITGMVAAFFGLILPGMDPEFDLFWVGNASTFIFVLAMALAILKHHMFEVKVLAAETFAFLMWAVALIELIISDGWLERGVRFFVLVMVSAFAVFLVKSVLNEVRQKELLHDLNTHLEEKVAEQTIEIRRAYEVEKKARHDLEELDKAKTDFILTTQHHLRTPLTVVKGMLNLALGEREVLPAPVTGYLEKAETNAEKLGSLVNEFLEISQMEVGKSILQTEEVTLYSLIPNVLSEIQDDMDKKNITLRESFTSEARNRELLIDKKKMHDALLNILDNAVKYTPAGGTVSIGGILTTHPIEKIRIYRLTISDSGIGMTEEERTHLFTRAFERGEKAKELNATGRGLGLMLTKQIITAHGGSIHAESEGRDKGTSFVIELPLENKG